MLDRAEGASAQCVAGWGAVLDRAVPVGMFDARSAEEVRQDASAQQDSARWALSTNVKRCGSSVSFRQIARIVHLFRLTLGLTGVKKNTNDYHHVFLIVFLSVVLTP
jgi:hypothetical protein